VIVAYEVLAGRHRSMRSYLAFIGPAVVAVRLMLPELADGQTLLLALGIVSQVVLSTALPLPKVALLIFTGGRDVMEPVRRRGPHQAAAIVATAMVLLLNVILMVQILGLPVPCLRASD
jgi:hypothetical protein